MISDAQYAAFLRSSAQKCVLVEAQAYHAGGVVTRYFSNVGYASLPTDTPANQAYPDRLKSVPQITAELREVFSGSSRVVTGEIIVMNNDGALNGWFDDAWDGRPVVIYVGSASWAKADFRPVFTGVIEDITAEATNNVIIKIRDRQQLFTLPAQTTLIGGTGVNKEARRPICYGACFNVGPVLVDDAARKYAVHDGQINAISAVREAGVTLALGIDYSVNLAAGEFTMLRDSTGLLTADVQGSKTGGVYVNKTADIMARIATERSGIASGDIDAASITAANTANGAPVGIYSASDETTVADLLDGLACGAGFYYSLDRLGILKIAQFTAASGSSPVMTVNGDFVPQFKTELVQRLSPPKSVRVGYSFNFKPQSYVDTTVSDADRARYAEAMKIEKATISAAQYLLAADADVIPGYYTNSADAAAEATRQAALWGIIRKVYRVPMFAEIQQLELGDEIVLQLPVFGLNAGVSGRVTAITKALTKNGGQIKVMV